MPEYLAPDVYVEEIDTGSKPIEGVSTSTAGMLGVTERGPSNVPILITSYGEFTRWFGGVLDPLLFVNPANPRDLHCFLPHAVEGFFTNGGKRVYVTRVEARGARRAGFLLHDRGTAASASAWLLRAAPELTGNTALTPLYVTNVNAVLPGTGALAVGDHIRFGGGSDAEYLDVESAANNGVGARTHATLTFPLARGHVRVGTLDNVQAIARAPLAGPNGFALTAAAPAGTAQIQVTTALANLAANQLLEIGSAAAAPFGNVAEYRYVQAVAGPAAGPVTVTLDSPLAVAHGVPTTVTKLDLAPAALANASYENGRDALPGERVVYLDPPAAAAFAATANIVLFDPLNVNLREARRVGQLTVLPLSAGAYDNYAAGSLVEVVTIAPDGAVAPNPKTLAADTAAGANVLPLPNRVGIVAGTMLQIGNAAPFEYAAVTQVPDRSPGLAAPDAGIVVIGQPLRASYRAGDNVVVLVAPAPDATRAAGALVLPARAGQTALVTTEGSAAAGTYAAADIVRITAPGAGTFLHGLTGVPAFADARPVRMTAPIAVPHAAGAPVAERTGLITVQALDTGAWGNRVRVSVADEAPGLVSRTPIIAAIAPNRVRLSSAAGVEPGTILEFVSAAGVVTVTVKVQAVERATAEATLDAAGPLLTVPQMAAINALAGAFIARSREFRMTVRVLAPPDPSQPGSGDTVLDREDFRNLSMDPRHSRYIQTVIGLIGVPGGPRRLSDRRPDGESWYVRVTDSAPGNGIRLGPEPLVDVLSDGRVEPARHALTGGNDSMVTLDDQTYIGQDNANPEDRTGLFSLRNIEDISIVAAPGRTSVMMQNALINHCEIARYRFAVLDAHRPPRDSIADVINQRQQFDTKYAAFYHPWLLIAPPFPVSAAQPPEYAIPPAGHVVGIYARTDIERGVHKAPANEVVRGVMGLQRLLNKGEHDILNPYPININVIRDFRPNSRGIRVYGGRVITSDSDWKYVNVRRLLIFIEASLNRGLQWVVFEPNAEPLWARVRRSIANFLTLVWRNGALEGTKVEEAFFVKCDRTTMTQTDIDSGRLICIVGVAPVKPAEFVIVRIGLWTAHADE